MYGMLPSWLALGRSPAMFRLCRGSAWPAASLAIPAVVYVCGAIIAVLIALVIWPAIWSKRPSRRKAAKDVLDSMLRALGSISGFWKREQTLCHTRPGRPLSYLSAVEIQVRTGWCRATLVLVPGAVDG